MFRKGISLLAAVTGGILFYALYTPPFVQALAGSWGQTAPVGFSLVGGTVIGLMFYIITPLAGKSLNWIDIKLKAIPTQDIVLIVFGLLVSLLVGLLVSIPLSRIPVVGVYSSLVITAFLAFMGVRLVQVRKEDFAFITAIFARQHQRQVISAGNQIYKILDTSVIIDGRIIDICKTEFLEGVMVVPTFVLEELRHIADSPDLLKRNRGRRGLDILNQIQKEMEMPVEIQEIDFDDITEVDSKLVKLAKIMNGKIVTNDFNLNKVCELHGIPVLNINELANAVKPVVLPGEEMMAQIIKDGKEAGQGIAYLDDGTMVVVEGGKRHMGETVEVMVTSVLQTAAGRMIFAKPKYSAERMSGVK